MKNILDAYRRPVSFILICMVIGYFVGYLVTGLMIGIGIVAGFNFQK